MQTYRRFVSYVYQYENGKKAGNRGFIKVEARGNTCSMQIALKGVCRDASGSCKIYGFKREDGLLKGSLLAECPVKTGVVQEQLAFLRSSMGNAGYSLHDLSGVIFQGDDQTMYGTQWDDEPMKMENFQPDERNVPRQSQEEPAQEEAAGQTEPPEQDAPWETLSNMTMKEESPKGMWTAAEEEGAQEQEWADPMKIEWPATQELMAQREWSQPEAERPQERAEAKAEPAMEEMREPEAVTMEEASEPEPMTMEEMSEPKAVAMKEAPEPKAVAMEGMSEAEAVVLEETSESKAVTLEEARGPEAAALKEGPSAPGMSAAEEPVAFRVLDAPQAPTEAFTGEEGRIAEARPAAPQSSQTGGESPTEEAVQPRAEFAAEHLEEREAAAEIIQPKPAPVPEGTAPIKAAPKEAQTKENKPGPNRGTQEKKEQAPVLEARSQNPPEPNRAFASADLSSNAEIGNAASQKKADPQEEGLPEVLDTTVDLAAFNMEATQSEGQRESGREDYIKQDMEAENVAEETVQEEIAQEAAVQEMAAREETVQEAAVQKMTMQEEPASNMRGAAEKRNFCPFTDGVLENCQKISLDDILWLDPRDQCLRNNRFVQHGYQMFGHLLIARMARNCQYILGVPGIYQQQEKFMADMHGFHNFKCARRRNPKMPCFGYWYRLIYPPKPCTGNGRAR